MLLGTDTEGQLYQVDLNSLPPMAYWQLSMPDIGNKPFATAYHPLERKIYWTDYGLELFRRAALDGSNVETFEIDG